MAIAGGLGYTANPYAGNSTQSYTYGPKPPSVPSNNSTNDFGPTTADKAQGFAATSTYTSPSYAPDTSPYQEYLKNLAGANDVWNTQQKGFLDSDYGLQQRMTDWQRGNNASDVSDANQNLAYRDQIIGNLQSMFGINDRGLANQIAQSLLDERTQTAILGTNLRQNDLDTLQQSQQLRSAGIAGGSMFFPGQGVGQTQIADKGKMAADIINQRLNQVKEGGGLTREGYNIGAEKDRLGLLNQILGQQQNRVGDQAGVRNAQSAGQKLDFQSQQSANDYAKNKAGLAYKYGIDTLNTKQQGSDAALKERQDLLQGLLNRYGQTGGQ